MVDSMRVDFEQIPWGSQSLGMRVKRSRRLGCQIRMVEVGLDFGEADWCEEGHVGYILQGVLETEIGGRTERLNAGDGLIIPSGREHRHRSRAVEGPVRLILIDDV